MADFTKNDFINDKEKMADFIRLSKQEFLQCYSYLTEQEYENTKKIYERTNKQRGRYGKKIHNNLQSRHRLVDLDTRNTD